MENYDFYNELDKESVKRRIKEIKQDNPYLKKEILATKKDLMKDISKQDKINGAWFPIILNKVLDTHAKNVSFEYFRIKYNTSVKDILAKKIIDSACNYSIMTGLICGASGGVLGVPTAIAATFGEVTILTYSQLKLIYNLALIYGKPIDLDDPEESYKLIFLILGIKSSEVLNSAIEIGAKNGGKIVVEKVGKRVSIVPIQKTMEAAGVKITQRAIKNFLTKAIPAIGIGVGGVLCSTIDYKLTKYVAYNSLSLYRTVKLIIELFENYNKIPFGEKKVLTLLLKDV